MTWWQEFKKRFGKKPPVIDTQWGPVTEGARKQAALNLRDDPYKLKTVIEMVGEKEARRRYPESFED
jgi:hypothetical protein